MTHYHNFVGIDIGKDSFFVAFHGETITTSYLNTDKGRQKFYEDHADRLKTALVVLETTGGYEYDLLSYLISQQVVVHRAHAQKIKSFIKSFGRLAKTDRIDALAIAHYASDRHKILKPYEPFEFLQTELRSLVERRIDLVQMLTQEKNRAKAPGNKSLMPYIEEIMESLKTQIKIIEGLIVKLIESNPVYNKKNAQLLSIPGIGKVVAYTLLALVPELGVIDRRKIASLTGLAPHPQQSGKRTGYARMSGGRRSLRPILFMAAMAARKSKSKLADSYNTLIAKGKKPLVALGAIMRRIIVIANAKLRDLRLQSEIQLAA